MTEFFSAAWLSILPPIVAIVLALITKEVISSLLFGILMGTLIYSNGSLIGMITNAFGIMGNKMGENVNIIIFLALLGAIVVIVTKGGGSRAYGVWAANKIKTRRGASLATSFLGCLIFIDDYFNCLTVGTVMRPVTDKHRISRAKLAYLLDATAAPICIIAPVSSWGASIATYIEDAVGTNGMVTFMKVVPYNLYAILTIIMIVIACSTKLNFGAMRKFEKNAIENGDLFSNSDVRVNQEEEKVSERGTVFDLIIPIATLIIATVLAMIYTGGGFTGGSSVLASFGKCDSSLSLVVGSFIALIVTFLLYMPRKILTFGEFMEGITEGIKSMVPAFTILILAWTIGGICSAEYLNTGGFVGELVQKYTFPVFILPFIVFFVSAFLGFATGTSWGTMAILIPIGASICMAESTAPLLFPVLGSILAGSVYGDHISPISDTTILSSTGAGCNHIDHVRTQLYYASTVAVACAVGYTLMGITKNFVIPLVVSIVMLLVLLYVFHTISEKKNGIDYSDVNF